MCRSSSPIASRALGHCTGRTSTLIGVSTSYRYSRWRAKSLRPGRAWRPAMTWSLSRMTDYGWSQSSLNTMPPTVRSRCMTSRLQKRQTRASTRINSAQYGHRHRSPVSRSACSSATLFGLATIAATMPMIGNTRPIRKYPKKPRFFDAPIMPAAPASVTQAINHSIVARAYPPQVKKVLTR